ncbi:DMT family transporter [Actinophytocola sp.]|uniref:DMT family transporter n=1 Tax=Actinophytocola sp. TaxID=1872138 RepID=UPI002ED46844
MSVRPARLSVALLVLAGVLWGTGGLAGAMLQSAAGLSPVAVAAYRLLVGGLLATVVVAGQLRYLRGRAALSRLLVAGGLLAQFQAAYQVAVAQIAVSLATLITIGCVPVFVVVISGVRERRVLLAVGTAVLGLALLSGGAAGADGWQVVSGVVMSLVAGAGFAALTLVSARPVPGQHVVTSAGLLLGGLFLLPLAGFDGMSVPLAGDVLALIGFLGLVPTALAYGSYFLGLRHAHPTAAALATMLEPLTATVLAVALHGERLTAAGVVGALLIAGALALYYLAPGTQEG